MPPACEQRPFQGEHEPRRCSKANCRYRRSKSPKAVSQRSFARGCRGDSDEGIDDRSCSYFGVLAGRPDPKNVFRYRSIASTPDWARSASRPANALYGSITSRSDNFAKRVRRATRSSRAYWRRCSKRSPCRRSRARRESGSSRPSPSSDEVFSPDRRVSRSTSRFSSSVHNLTPKRARVIAV